VTIGLDLGDRRTAVCVIDRAGDVLARDLVATTRTALTTALQAYPAARVVLEVGTHSPWVSRLLAARGAEVVLANPRRVRQIAAGEDKDDPIDAELLARLGRADPQLVRRRAITHGSEQAQHDRALLRVRDGLVRARAALVTQARGLAKALGAPLPKCDPQYFARRLAREKRVGTFPGLDAVVRTLGALTAEIRTLERTITQVARTRYPATARLRAVNGVGPITALAYVLAIEDPARFRRSRDVGAYVGLRPKRYDSGTSTPQLRITKAGNPYVRRMLVQAAHSLLRRGAPDTALRRFGERLAQRGGKAARKKAVIAVARKLAVVLHRVWVTGEPYEPLRGVPAAAA
jgi:transposase